MIAEAWLTEGYREEYIDLEHRKARFTRAEADVSHLNIPKVLTEKKIPDNAAFELEHHMAYIIKKYGL